MWGFDLLGIIMLVLFVVFSWSFNYIYYFDRILLSNKYNNSNVASGSYNNIRLYNHYICGNDKIMCDVLYLYFHYKSNQAIEYDKDFAKVLEVYLFF